MSALNAFYRYWVTPKCSWPPGRCSTPRQEAYVASWTPRHILNPLSYKSWKCLCCLHTYHFLGTVRGLYFLNLILHSICALHLWHTEWISMLLSCWVRLLLSWSVFLNLDVFWYFCGRLLVAFPLSELIFYPMKISNIWYTHTPLQYLNGYMLAKTRNLCNIEKPEQVYNSAH